MSVGFIWKINILTNLNKWIQINIIAVKKNILAYLNVLFTTLSTSLIHSQYVSSY